MFVEQDLGKPSKEIRGELHILKIIMQACFTTSSAQFDTSAGMQV